MYFYTPSVLCICRAQQPVAYRVPCSGEPVLFGAKIQAEPQVVVGPHSLAAIVLLGGSGSIVGGGGGRVEKNSNSLKHANETGKQMKGFFNFRSAVKYTETYLERVSMRAKTLILSRCIVIFNVRVCGQ